MGMGIGLLYTYGLMLMGLRARETSIWLSLSMV